MKKAHKVIDEYANRGLRSLGVSRQVNKMSNTTCHEFTVKHKNENKEIPLTKLLHLVFRLFQKRTRRVQENHGNSWDSCPSLTLQGMTVPRLFVVLLTLVSTLR